MPRVSRLRPPPGPEVTLNLDALVAPLRADVVSGAAVVARTAAEVVRRAAVRVPADTVDELRDTLASLAVRILDAQPAMAPLVALGARTLDATGKARSLEDARRATAHEAEAFRDELERSAREAGRAAARELPARGTVLTLSSSSTVREALLRRAGRGSSLKVICLESRPMKEGRALAEALAREDVPTLYAVDAAAASLLPRADLVLLGADSVGDHGIVNKVGSAALAGLAAEREIPLMVVTDGTKLLPAGFPQPTDDDRPGEEVWRAPAGIRVWNRYFELVPTARVSTIVTEDGPSSPEEVERARSRLRVPPELRRWAEGRAGREAGSGEEPGSSSGV